MFFLIYNRPGLSSPALHCVWWLMYNSAIKVWVLLFGFSETETPATEGRKGDSLENEHASGGVSRQRLFPVFNLVKVLILNSCTMSDKAWGM